MTYFSGTAHFHVVNPPLASAVKIIPAAVDVTQSAVCVSEHQCLVSSAAEWSAVTTTAPPTATWTTAWRWRRTVVTKMGETVVNNTSIFLWSRMNKPVFFSILWRINVTNWLRKFDFLTTRSCVFKKKLFTRYFCKTSDCAAWDFLCIADCVKS